MMWEILSHSAHPSRQGVGLTLKVLEALGLQNGLRSSSLKSRNSPLCVAGPCWGPCPFWGALPLQPALLLLLLPPLHFAPPLHGLGQPVRPPISPGAALLWPWPGRCGGPTGPRPASARLRAFTAPIVGAQLLPTGTPDFPRLILNA